MKSWPGMGEALAGQLFISYRRSRKAAVLAAKATLAAAGIDVWLDLEDIDPLADFPERIRAGIDASHAMLVWWSADYAEPDICLQELRRGWQHARRHSSDVARRVWVLNPEAGGKHIFAGELNSSNFLAPPQPGEEAAWAADLNQRVDALLPEGPLADERHAEPAPPIHGAPTPSREFTGRGAELMRIHSALFPARVGAAAAGVGVQVHGLGGLGKTELAAKYLADFTLAFPAGVLWLNLAPWRPARPATETDAQNAWLRALDAALAHAPEMWRHLALDPEGKARPAPEVRQRLARHLSGEQPCLVVLDNLPELTPLDARRRILDFLAAPGPQGKTLITTRDARPVEGYAELSLDVLAPDDALRLLARYRPAQAAAEREAMAALVAEVGGHTQALVLLGERYRGDSGGYPRALTALREQGALPRIDDIATRLADELGAKARGIVATFAISIEPLSDNARHLLALASVCAPNTPISDALLALAFGGEAREDNFALALRALLRASLLERRGEDGHLRIHPLVGQVTLERLKPDRAALRRALAKAALERLAVLDHDLSRARTLVADATQAEHLAAQGRDETAVHLLLAVGQCQAGRGQFPLARKAGEAALALASETLGPDDPATLRAKSILAEALRARSEFAGARSLQEELCEARRRQLGEEDPATLQAAANLAATLWAEGDFTEAQAIEESVWESSRRKLGADDPATLRSMHNLAETLRAQGELKGARALLERVREANHRLGREEHPDHLAALNNLALILHAQGELDRARGLHERVANARRDLLGEDHPRTLTSMNNLAEALRALGELKDARELLEKVRDASRRVLGEDHPDTMSTIGNLAGILLADGQREAARELLEQVLTAHRRVLGREHADTALSAWSLFVALDDGDDHAARMAVLANDLGWLVERDPAILGT